MIPTCYNYKNNKLDRRDKILLSVFIAIIFGLAIIAFIPPASATITITPTTITSTSITWSWPSVTIQNLSIDGMFIYSIDPSSTSFFLSGLGPNEAHTIKIVTAGDSGTNTATTLGGATATSPAATKINVSLLFATGSTPPADYGAFGNWGNLRTYSYTTPDKNTITALSVKPAAAGVTTIVLTRADRSQITVIESLTQDTPVSGTAVLSVNDVSHSYSFYPNVWWMSPSAVLVGINTQTKTEYLIFTDQIHSISQNNGLYFEFDPNDTAYVELPNLISTNAIVSMSESSNVDTTITGDILPVEDVGNSEIEVLHNDVCSGWVATLGLCQIVSGLSSTIDLISTLGQDLKWLTSGGLFIITGEAFLIVNATYEAIVLVLCIDDATEIDKVVTKWIRYQVKLWKFYMMLYKDMKEIIKWW